MGVALALKSQVRTASAHVLDRGGMRRAWLRGRQNIHKRYLIHFAGFNLGILMRAMFGQGTPREAASARSALLFSSYVGDRRHLGHRQRNSNARHHHRARDGLIKKRHRHRAAKLEMVLKLEKRVAPG